MAQVHGPLIRSNLQTGDKVKLVKCGEARDIREVMKVREGPEVIDGVEYVWCDNYAGAFPTMNLRRVDNE